MWTVITNIDFDKWESDNGAGTVTANYVKDGEPNFTYSRRVTLGSQDDVNAFVAEAKEAKQKNIDYATKADDISTSIESSLNS